MKASSSATQAELAISRVPSESAQAILLKTCLRLARCAVKLSDRSLELRALVARLLSARGNARFVVCKLLLGYESVALNRCRPFCFAHPVSQVGIGAHNQS